MTATFYIGDALEVMGKLPEKSVDLILSSPPFLALRSYLPSDHPDKAKEGGSQATPGEYIDWLVDVVEACARVLAPHGSLCFELGDTYAGSGEGGGDLAGTEKYPAGQRTSSGTAWRSKKQGGWPLPKSLSLIPELFRLTLVYGVNPLTGRQTERWRLRNVIRWVRPNPPVGALGDKFRPATSELMVFCKSAKRYFDLDAVREPYAPLSIKNSGGPFGDQETPSEGGPKRRALGRLGVNALTHSGAPPLDWWEISLLDDEARKMAPKGRASGPGSTESGRVRGPKTGGALEDHRDQLGDYEANPLGAPPLDWWNIPPGGYEGAHYAVFPPELCVKPIKAMSPEQVCRTCGEPRRRITEHLGEERRLAPPTTAEFSKALTAAMTRRDVTHHQVAGWLGVDEAMVRHYLGKTGLVNWQLPSIAAWKQLAEVLPFDESTVRAMSTVEPTYQTADRGNRQIPGRLSGGALNGDLPKVVPTGWTDCGHDNYRPGLVLDPFAGSGTTLAVATGHGRDAIGIDLDSRNFDLALDRVGPLILERG